MCHDFFKFFNIFIKGAYDKKSIMKVESQLQFRTYLFYVQKHVTKYNR